VQNPIVVWIRNDLRLDDNPALYHAVSQKKPLVILYIRHEKQIFPLGKSSTAWLEYALYDFSKNLEMQRLVLAVEKGEPLSVLEKILKKNKAKALFYNRACDPEQRAQDAAIEKKLSAIEIQSFQPNLLFEPGAIVNKKGDPFKVFTSFYNVTRLLEPDTPCASVKSTQQQSDMSNALEKPSSSNLWKHWEPTEHGAKALLKEFIDKKLCTYEADRNFPAIDGTSRLSPYLHFGQISIRRIWHEVSKHDGEFFLRELIWREFAHHLLYYFPDMPKHPLNDRYKKFPWEKDKAYVTAWQEGKTGYPIIDAGMRQLQEMGWMHNRVRMIVGSFLVKHLLQPWQDGFDWFWQYLVDADLANNSMGWQWVAGCGADAAPYFRVFNPVLQAKKFDPDGEYVKRFVPELQGVSKEYMHEPWTCEGIKDYPKPIISLDEGRKKALDAFAKI